MNDEYFEFLDCSPLPPCRDPLPTFCSSDSLAIECERDPPHWCNSQVLTAAIPSTFLFKLTGFSINIVLYIISLFYRIQCE